jgi:hypothetical protein
MIGTVSGLARLVAALEDVQNASAPNLKSPNPKRPIQVMVAINATANNVAGQMRRKIMTPGSIFAPLRLVLGVARVSGCHSDLQHNSAD